MKQRNIMSIKDVRFDTEIDTYTYRPCIIFYEHRRPTQTLVTALKPCGCEGPDIGMIEAATLPKHEPAWEPPFNWDPVAHGYSIVRETRGRVALYRNGDRLFGKRQDHAPTDAEFIALAWHSFEQARRAATAPMHADGHIHPTVEDALTRIPRGSHCKLWALLPYKNDGWKQRRTPVGYVWGAEMAALALRNWRAAENEKAINNLPGAGVAV